ncbi:BURP domain-containing protein 5-like [Nymphaea colorata]|nr:BURP domain-containing protein 5-like [Nymphaea colorata]
MSVAMDHLASFFLLSTLFLHVGATSNGSVIINAYWKEVFPRTTMPDAIRALLPSSAKISDLVRRDVINNHHPVESKEAGRAYCPWCNTWGGIGRGHGSNTFNLSDDWSKRNRSPELAPLYFLRKDLLPGSKMNVTMTISPVADRGEPTFLPCQQAQAIPFSSSNLATILEMFSIEPHSEHASLARETLDDCETPALKGELKYCATSLESMIDFAVAEFGTNEIHAAVTSVVNRDEEVKARTYKVGVGGGRVMSRKVVTCHNMMFPYAVFYCHNLAWTRAYMVPLVAEDGSRVNAIALCHFDTSNWNPGHASFRVLGVKPGTVPICHFILKDLAWVPN